MARNVLQKSILHDAQTSIKETRNEAVDSVKYSSASEWGKSKPHSYAYLIICLWYYFSQMKVGTESCCLCERACIFVSKAPFFPIYNTNTT